MKMSSRVATNNMGTITQALECSLQKCSLNHHHHQPLVSTNSSSYDDNDNDNKNRSSIHHHHHQSTTLDLNSHLSLPYHWEQCLDLKTGEIYYINWRNGMKAKEDPRSTTTEEDEYISEEYCYYYSEDDEDDDDSSYDSEESSTEYSSNNKKKKKFVVEDQQKEEEEGKDVLVVGGCKRCLMYFMVPKHLQDCPKCNIGQLLHFDRSENDIIP